ncbi:hypothetical protein CEQ20_03985 [Yersinia pseudotuberculosis]|nr:hypothetical protein CEQ20_03985 [Yersinia pseudotuberculosis]PEI12226.1 hypothetical protein CRM78_02520 [Yersinia pseudotuberculosis]
MRTNALLALFLLPLLSACGTTQIKYVQTPHVPIPASLLSDCMPPLIPDELTWGDSLALNGELLTVIELCNLDKASIRKIEESRNGS